MVVECELYMDGQEVHLHKRYEEETLASVSCKSEDVLEVINVARALVLKWGLGGDESEMIMALGALMGDYGGTVGQIQNGCTISANANSGLPRLGVAEQFKLLEDLKALASKIKISKCS